MAVTYETMHIVEKEINPATINVISCRKEYWQGQGSNQQHPVLRACHPQATELNELASVRRKAFRDFIETA